MQHDTHTKKISISTIKNRLRVTFFFSFRHPPLHWSFVPSFVRRSPSVSFKKHRPLSRPRRRSVRAAISSPAAVGASDPLRPRHRSVPDAAFRPRRSTSSPPLLHPRPLLAPPLRPRRRSTPSALALRPRLATMLRPPPLTVRTTSSMRGPDYRCPRADERPSCRRKKMKWCP